MRGRLGEGGVEFFARMATEITMPTAISKNDQEG
jgi:hypothetical protein